MVSFIKNVFSSCLGTIFGLGLIILILIGIGSALGSVQSDIMVRDRSVLKLKLPQYIPERTNNLPMGWEFVMQENIWGIHELVHAIEKASEDDKIEAMIIEPSNNASFVHMDLLRQAIGKFQGKGKPVYAYGDNLGQTDLYLTSKANKIYLNPLGQAEVKGFAVVEPFMKDALDNAGIEMEVYYAGDFKSATEPFRRNSMSEENEIQLREFINEMYDNFIDSLAVSRGLSRPELLRISRTYASRSAQDAVKLGLVDAVGYDSDMIRDLKSELGYEDTDRLNVINLTSYRKGTGKTRNYFAEDKVAVVYFEGEIREGNEERGNISAKRYLPILRKIKRDDDIKAVVLRVNSPGGNALTSDRILNEIRDLQMTGKKVVASLGDVAASGGYYIAASADSIFASHQTITGSIGVFAMFPNFNSLFEDKLNIYLDSVSTSPYAGMGNLLLERSEKEKRIFQQMTDSMYQTFLNIVARGRDMTVEEVHKVAQGRIWTGESARDNGLIDRIGDLNDAIHSAVAISGAEDYRIVEYPEVKSPIEQLTEQLDNTDDVNRQIEQHILSRWPLIARYSHLLKDNESVQAWMPYEFLFN